MTGCQIWKSDIVETDENILGDFYLSDLSMHQSMAFHGINGYFVRLDGNELICDIYNLSLRKKESQVSLDYSAYPAPHANTTCFGKDFYSDESVAPALYVSAWNNQRQAFVYDIRYIQGGYTSELIQIIDPNKVSNEIIGYGYLDWVVDADDGYLYSIAYHLKETADDTEGNYTHIVKFKLPKINQPQVILEDMDVIDFFTVPVMSFFQDKDFNRGHILIVAGMPDDRNRYPPCLFDINAESGEIKKTIIPLVGEPEGFCVYEDQMWINMYGSTAICNINNLI